jgi:hypothetical protein
MTNMLTRDARAGLLVGGDRLVRPGLVLAVVLIGQFMAVLDASIVNVAAPSIHARLHASGAGLQLAVAGYTITYAVLLVTGARLGDILGHRRVFLAGLVLFTLASLGCGLAGTAGLLVALRFAQGAGAAVMIPQVLSLIQRTHAGPARARAMSSYSAVLAGGAVVGQLAGPCAAANRRRRPNRRSPRPPGYPRPGPGRSSPAPAPAWSRTARWPRSRPRRAGPGRRPRTSAGTAPGNQRVPAGWGVAEIDRDLAILHPARRPAVLPGHPGAGRPASSTPDTTR